MILWSALIVLSIGLQFAISSDVGYFNITIKDEQKRCTLSATLGSTHTCHQGWMRRICSWNKQIGSNTWNVTFNGTGLKITIKPFSGTVAEGTWECKYITRGKECTEWKIAHVYEDLRGYLIHEIELKGNCEATGTSIIECKKTNHGPKYIAVRKELSRDTAQKYCSKKYEDGSLSSFKDVCDWNNLINLIKKEPSHSYWTGLKTNQSYSEFSDGTSAEYVKTKFTEQNSFSNKNGCYLLTRSRELRLEETCSRKMYFICQVNQDYAMKGIIVDIAILGGSGSILVDPNEKDVQMNLRSKQPHRFVLPEDTKTVTIKAPSGSEGILASFSNGIVTDDSWSCDASGPHFPNPNWQNASVTEPNVSRPQEIASNANWIWIRDSDTTSVRFKRTFGIEKIGIDVNITIDNCGSIETDTGEQRNVSCELFVAERFTLREDTKVVTIKAHNDPGDVGAILASFSNDVVTDESWECAKCNSENCNSTASWEQAKSYGNNNGHADPWGTVHDQIIRTINTAAQWIWVSSRGATKVWCKKTFATPTSTQVPTPSCEVSKGPSQESTSSNNEATSLASSSPSIPLSSSTPTSIVTSALTKGNTTAPTVTSVATGTNGTKPLTATPNIISSSDISGSAWTSLSSKVNPTSTGPSFVQSTPTTDKKKIYNESLSKVNLIDKDAAKQIMNITTNFLTMEKNERDVNPAVFVAPILEDTMIKYAKINLHKRHNGTYNKTTKYFEIFITFVTPKKFPSGYITFPKVEQNANGGEQGAESDNFITIPVGSSYSNSSIFAGILFNTEESSVNTAPGRNTNEPKLISKILSAEIDPKPSITDDLGNITFTLSHEKGYDNVLCAFLDEDTASTFSTRGCSAVSFDENSTKCTCNHMTSFAVVTKIDRNPIDASHRKALSIITYVGMTLSLIGEVLTVCCYVLLIGLNTDQAHLHTNLALSLALAQIFFLVGMSTASSEAACLVVTAMIHYFYLVTFCWMLVEGFHLYLMVVKVFNESSYLKFYYLFSWITPLIIVSLALIAAAASSAGIYGYLSIEEICWISYENNYIWFFLGPVLIICLTNLVLLILVVREMTKMNKTKAGGPSLHFRKSVKACLLLFPILGTSWLFAVILMLKYSLAVEYIFNILNSVQGFLIFLFYVMRSSEIRAVVQQRKARWATTLDLTNHQSTYHKTTTTSGKSKPASASSIKPILGSWTGTKPRSSSTLSSRRSSSQSTPSPRNSPSLRNTPSPQDSPSLCDSPNPRETPTPTACHSHNIQFKSPSRLTTSDPLDLIEIPRRPSSRNKISPEVEIYDAETSA